jgi:hypothetical protein
VTITIYPIPTTLGQQPSASSASVVVASDQVVLTTQRDPVQVINSATGDPLVVQTNAHDINNILNPVTVGNFPASQPVSLAQTVAVTGSVAATLTGQSIQNPVPVILSDGSLPDTYSGLYRQIVTALNAGFNNASGGFFSPEPAAFNGA